MGERGRALFAERFEIGLGSVLNGCPSAQCWMNWGRQHPERRGWESLPFPTKD